MTHPTNCICPECKHHENCDCPVCKPHQKNCGCPQCKEEEHHCHCPECNKHDSNCTCPECGSKNESTLIYQPNGESVTVLLNGRFDSTKSAECSNELLDTLNKYNTVIFDMENTSYISSAFLRILIQMTKKAKETHKIFKLTKLQQMVIEILMMSGMNKILNIA